MPAIAALAWSVWMFWLGTDDRRQVVGLPSTASEAVQHVVAFAVLGALVMATERTRPWAVFSVLALAGVLAELVQLAVPSRTFSVVDMLFSAAGAAIGVAFARGSGWRSTMATASIAVLVVASAPVALRVSEPEPDTSFAADCFPAPPLAPGPPEVVLAQDFASSSGTDGGAAIEIEEPTAAELRDQVVATGELTASVEFSTTNLDQTGPVRLFTISDGIMTDEVNFHVGLEHDDLSIRLRTSCELFNWVIVPDVVRVDTVQRVDVTWGAGTLEVWVDAVKVLSTSLPWGDLERWDPTYRILVGDEVGGGRQFDGTVYSVTMWDQALDEQSLLGAAKP
jgi:hypothetical protein